MKLSNNLTIEQLLKTSFGNQFTQEQKLVILQAVEIGIDLAEIAKPEFNDEQMCLIFAAHKSGWDYKPFTKHVFNRRQCDALIRGVYSQIDASLYADPALTVEQMRLAYKYLFNDDVDVVDYIRQGFSEKQLNIIVHGLKQCLDVDAYTRLEYSSFEMLQIRSKLERLKNMKLRSYESVNS